MSHTRYLTDCEVCLPRGGRRVLTTFEAMRESLNHDDAKAFGLRPGNHIVDRQDLRDLLDALEKAERLADACERVGRLAGAVPWDVGVELDAFRASYQHSAGQEGGK